MLNSVDELMPAPAAIPPATVALVANPPTAVAPVANPPVMDIPPANNNNAGGATFECC